MLSHASLSTSGVPEGAFAQVGCNCSKLGVNGSRPSKLPRPVLSCPITSFAGTIRISSMEQPEDELIPGTLDLLILKAVLSDSLHGYGIAHWVHENSKEVLHVEEGSLYPALRRLEVRGFVSTSWGVSENNRRAKFYKITPAGRKHLQAESLRWNRLSSAVNFILAER